MITAVLVCVGACLAFTAAAPVMGRRMPPPVAVRLLTAGSLIAAGCGGFMLAVLAFIWLGQIGEVAEIGHWSPATLQETSTIPGPVGVAAGAILLPLVLLGVRAAASRSRALLDVHLTFRKLGGPGRIAIIDSAVPDAFTTPELIGRIVVTTGMLAALDDDQQRALIAHERSHLTHRHTWWRLTADLAAAVNPLLRPTIATVAWACERWADEDAAAVVGDRHLAARAVAAAALAARRQTASPAISAATGGHVPQRVRALLAPPPRRRPLLTAALVMVLAIGTTGAIVVGFAGDHLFDHAALSAHQPALWVPNRVGTHHS